MKALVLCAGLGERLLPLTRTVPKPALPVLGRPLVCQILARLAREGIREAVVNLHHIPSRLVEAVGDGTSLGLERVHYTHEPEILGTAGALREAAAHLQGEKAFLVHNGDFLSDIPVGDVVEFHRSSGCPATIAVAAHRRGFTEVHVDGRGRVLAFGGPCRPRGGAGSYLFTGFQVISTELLERIPAGRPSDLVRDLYRGLAASRQVAAYVHEGFWWEFGSAPAFLEGCLRLFDLPAERRARIAQTDPIRDLGGARLAAGPGADLHAGGIVLRGRVALGFASLVAEGSTLEDTVVMNEAWVGPGSSLRRVIVGPETEVPAGSTIEEAVVCPDADPTEELPEGTQRRDGLLVRSFASAEE